MSAPTAKVRASMLERDKYRCVACGERTNLEAQHRAAVGMGGSKVRPTLDQLLTACAPCNTQFESDLQTRALLCGWKVRRWVNAAYRVPVYYAVERVWYLVNAAGGRTVISPAKARGLMVEVYGADVYAEWEAA